MKRKIIIAFIMLVAIILFGCDIKKIMENTEKPTFEITSENTESKWNANVADGNVTPEIAATNESANQQEITVINESPSQEPFTTERTVKNMLLAAIEPVGRCLYVWGGAWNEEDTGAGIEAMTLGASPRWYEFFCENDSSYDFENTRYQIHDGLDCSGFIGYLTYQIFEDTYSDNGYVYKAGEIPEKYLEIFGGSYTQSGEITDYQPCDIMGKKGHIFIVVGECEDGSVVFIHSSPPALSLCGTPTPDGNTESKAVLLARKYMSEYRSECYNRYDTCSRGTSFLTDYNQFRWNPDMLTDPDGYRDMTAEEILADLFDE